MHPAGQGVWVARMAGELGAHPILCGFIGGETGTVLQPLLDELPGSRRLVRHGRVRAARYVIDRRSGERDMVASALERPAVAARDRRPFSVTVAAASRARCWCVCGPVP